MLTGYLVKCPCVGCRWYGELSARPSPEAWREPASVRPTVVFECPRCQHEWRARVIGNGVQPLPPESADDLEPALWPDIDLGEGG
jgi:hypothetical protein